MWRVSVDSVDEEKKSPKKAGNDSFGKWSWWTGPRIHDGKWMYIIRTVEIYMNTWQSLSDWLWGTNIFSDGHGQNIFVGSFHVLMERYLTTDSVIVVLVLFNIDTLEVSIGVSTPSIPFMWNWLFALDEALQDLYYSLSTESADRFLKIVNRKMFLFRYKEFFYMVEVKIFHSISFALKTTR